MILNFYAHAKYFILTKIFFLKEANIDVGSFFFFSTFIQFLSDENYFMPSFLKKARLPWMQEAFIFYNVEILN